MPELEVDDLEPVQLALRMEHGVAEGNKGNSQ